MTEEVKVLDENELVPERMVVFEEALEAILFAAGHPISYATLARVFEMTPAKIKEKVFEYSLVYNNHEIPRGVVLLTFKDTCQLCTKQHYLTEIRDALGIKKSGTLSSSALEVLAIVAYNQPVTRAFVDTLRRVDSSYAMNNLIDRGLIASTGRLDVPGRPMLYGTTQDFLRSFGISSLDELPRTTEELMEAFNNAKGEKKEEEIEGQISADIDSALENVLSNNAAVDNNTSTAESDSLEILDEPSADDGINID